MKLNLLVVDDDPLIKQSLELIIEKPWQLHTASSLQTIPVDIPFHAAFVDMHLSNNENKAEGLQVLSNLRQSHPHAECIAISGDLSRQLMEKGLQNGASRFLAKPLGQEEILLTLEKIEAHILMQNTLSQNSHKTKTPWIGSSAHAEKVRQNIAQLKGETKPILISGETGTGKEIVAQWLGAQEPGPLIQVNIAAIPDNLFESELFGHVKGAFTGAEQNKMGLAEAANNGTLILDEIEALSLPLQVKLLRFLESGEIRKVGQNQSIHLKVRVLALTNENLEQKVRAGQFREDLLWRLKSHEIHLPSLRDRKEDIGPLAEYFLSLERPKRHKTLSEESIESLQKHSWPGNVRELKRVCEQLCLISPLPILRAQDVEQLLRPSQNSQNHLMEKNIDFSQGLSQLVNQYEANLIKTALEQEKDMDSLARLLQISRSNLYKKVKDYNITKD